MMNDKAQMVYECIKDRCQNGFPPTVREICQELGFKSTSTAHRYIKILEEQGLLEKGPKKNRAVRLIGSDSMLIPVVGTVTAGEPILAIENITGYVSWINDRNYSNPLFALKIRGESMIKVGINDGDVVVVEQIPVAENGEIVVAMTEDNEATVKRFYKEDGRYRLQPENDFMEPMYFDEISILGIVRSLIRYY